MAKYRKPTPKMKKSKDDGISLVALILVTGGFLLGYLGGELFLYPYPHPVHWVPALVFALLGYFIGQVIYRRYGDIL